MLILTASGSFDKFVNGLKTIVLDILVAVKVQPEVTIGAGDHRREFVAAELTQKLPVTVGAVAHFEKVEHAVV